MDFRRVMGMVPATCTYWKNASCFKGDRCTFFHGFICRDDGVCSDQTCDKSHFKQKDPALTQIPGVTKTTQRPQPPFLKSSTSNTTPIITSTTTTTTTFRRTENQGQPILIPHQVLQAQQQQQQQQQQTQSRPSPAFKPTIQHYKRSDRSRSRSRSYSPRRRRHSSSRSPSPRGDRDRSRSYRHKKSERDSYYDSKDSSRRSKFKPIGESDGYRSIDDTSSKDRESSYHRSSTSRSYDSKSYSKDSSRRRSHSREK